MRARKFYMMGTSYENYQSVVGKNIYSSSLLSIGKYVAKLYLFRQSLTARRVSSGPFINVPRRTVVAVSIGVSISRGQIYGDLEQKKLDVAHHC